MFQEGASRHVCQDIFQVLHWGKPICFGSLNQCIDPRTCGGSFRTSCKHPVLSSNHEWLDVVFCERITDRTMFVFQIIEEFLTVISCIIKRFGKFGLWQFGSSTFFCPRLKSLEKRFLADKTFFFLLLRRKILQFSLYIKKFIQPEDYFCGFWCFRGMDILRERIYKSPAQMRIAQAAFYSGKPIVSGISICMDITFISLQECFRIFSAPSRLVLKIPDRIFRPPSCCSKLTYKNRKYSSAQVLSVPVHEFHRYANISVSEVLAWDDERCAGANPDRRPEASLTWSPCLNEIPEPPTLFPDGTVECLIQTFDGWAMQA